MSAIREWLFRQWYAYVNRKDTRAEILFMNYGFHDPSEHIPLEAADEINRYSIQLYHRLASRIPLKGKDLIEIGSGRGGGLDYVCRTFKPHTAIGIDLDPSAAEFGNRHYASPGLKFMQGDAQRLNLPNASADVIINVESSHRYPDFPSFMHEVVRILRPGGTFLYTDFRYPHEMSDLKKDLDASGLRIVEEVNINPQVIASLDADAQRRKELVGRLVPGLLQKTALNFAGAPGSKTYRQIAEGAYLYYIYIMQKKGD
jgi:ubiquinone/menaquinone biosynthesis C-methylase UbiE